MKRGVTIGSVLLLALVVFALRQQRTPVEPQIQGRPVTAWALDLNSPSAVIREAATETIQHCGPEVVPALVRLLRSPDPLLSRPIRLLNQYASKRVAQRVLKVIDPSQAPAQRAAAVNALRIMGPNARDALPALSKALSEDSTVSWNAALTLAHLGQPGLDALTAAAASSSDLQCGFICYALGTQGAAASNAIPVLESVLQHRSPDPREKAATALGKMKRPAIPALLRSLTHTNPQVQVLAIKAIGSMGPLGRDAVSNLLPLGSASETEVRVATVEALSQIRPGAENVISLLLSALADPARPVRLKAAHALDNCPLISARLVPSLIAALDDESPEVRAQAANLLGRATEGREKAAAALFGKIQETNEWVRAAVQKALEQVNQAPTGL